jgi:hypothetical protein
MRLLNLVFFGALLFSCSTQNDSISSGTSTTTTTNGIQAQIVLNDLPAQARIWIRPNNYIASDSLDDWSFVQTTITGNGELNWSYTYTGQYDSLTLWIMDSAQIYGAKRTIPTRTTYDLGKLELMPLTIVQGQLIDRTHPSDSSGVSNLAIQGYPFAITIDSVGNFSIPLVKGAYKWINRLSGVELQSLIVDGPVDTLRIGLLSYDSISITEFDTLMARAESYWSFDDTLDGLISDDLRQLNPGEIWREVDLVDGVKNGAIGLTDTRFEHLSFNTSVFHFAAALDFSFSLWFRVDTSSLDSLPILWKEAPGLSRYLLQVLPNGRLEFSLRQFINIDKAVTSPMEVRDGQWHHVTCLRRGDVMELWIDGTLQDSTRDQQIQISPLDDGILQVGADRTNTWRFKGFLDEMTLFLFALDSAQIIHLYETHAQ